MKRCLACSAHLSDGPLTSVHITRLYPYSPHTSHVQNDTAASNIEEILQQPCFAECRDDPSCIFLSLSNGKAYGGQLPDVGNTGSLEQRWAHEKAYYLIDECKSSYKVHKDGDTSWGTVHLELQEVRCHVELNTLRTNMQAAERTKAEPLKHKWYVEEVRVATGL